MTIITDLTVSYAVVYDWAQSTLWTKVITQDRKLGPKWLVWPYVPYTYAAGYSVVKKNSPIAKLPSKTIPGRDDRHTTGEFLSSV